MTIRMATVPTQRDGVAEEHARVAVAPRKPGRSRRWRSLAAGLVICLGLASMRGPGIAARAEGVVSTNSTTALLQALLGGGEVTLTFTETLTLQIPIVIAADTVLRGQPAAARRATLSGGGTHRLFHVLPGIRFEIRDCVLQDGLSTNGGAILNEGMLRASNVVFSSCRAAGIDGVAGSAGDDRLGIGENGGDGRPGLPGLGGAVFNPGEATFVDCTFGSNSATGGKGGNGGDGGNGTVRDGRGGDGAAGAGGFGGAIANPGWLAVTNSFFYSNTAVGGAGGAGGSDEAVAGSGVGAAGAPAAGGAIHNEGWLLLARCSFATNSATGGLGARGGAPSVNIGRDGAKGGGAFGGALSSWATGTVVNSTFFTNRVVPGNGGDGVAGTFTVGDGGDAGNAFGGGIHARGQLDLRHVTVAFNTVTNGVGGAAGGDVRGRPGSDGLAAGGGVSVEEGTVALANSIVVAPGMATLYGPVQDLGHNLYSDGGTGKYAEGSLYDADARFGDFAVWTTGTTPAFLLQVGSPAIDAANPTNTVAVDQRGLPRPAGLGPDIGAIEVGASSFFIRGRVLAGDRGVSGVAVLAAERRYVTGDDGRFEFGPVPAGFYTVSLEGGGQGFTPRLVQLPLLADATNVVFRASSLVLTYRRDADGSQRLSSSGIPGRTYRAEATVNWDGWSTVGSTVADAQGRIDIRLEATADTSRFYRLSTD